VEISESVLASGLIAIQMKAEPFSTPPVRWQAGLTSNFESGVQRFLFKTGQILVGKGATIDVSGTTDAAVDLSKYVMKVELRGSELADSPSYREPRQSVENP